jgi:hypothetical protein
MQSRLDSFIEAWLNVLIGFFISVLANFIIFPWVGLSASTGQILWIGAGMTLVSVARSYMVRRFANKYLTQFREKIVEFLKREVL